MKKQYFLNGKKISKNEFLGYAQLLIYLDFETTHEERTRKHNALICGEIVDGLQIVTLQ